MDGNGKYGVTNSNSIGIEICVNPDSVYDVAVNKTIELVEYLMKKYNIPKSNVIRHYDASMKVCPASMYKNNWENWKVFYDRIGKTVQIKPNVTVSFNGEIHNIDGYFINEKNYVSVRGLCEVLGYNVVWKDGVVVIEK